MPAQLVRDHFTCEIGRRRNLAAVQRFDQGLQRAFAWLDDAYEAHNFNLAELKANPMFDTLRSDPRYADLLGRMRLAP